MGWTWRRFSQSSEHKADVFARARRRRRDVRSVRIVVEESGQVRKWYIKQRFPNPRPELRAINSIAANDYQAIERVMSELFPELRS
jgi:hypothetical protein